MIWKNLIKTSLLYDLTQFTKDWFKSSKILLLSNILQIIFSKGFVCLDGYLEIDKNLKEKTFVCKAL